ncbi:hypothetical protein [Gluconobacter kondonii]|uniref:hypothetical protein n=1 Tax=Gluconobacter kondonii TaxID=941463 RepID=UPI001B8C1398|nr:hypothetical protein [Gluconobacter kondonii]MBS1058045.1 hypothetical protein [Gluconobacter kondonii]
MLSSDALYYPFSRCMDSSTLKQYLLLFDSLTFLDAVDDDQWRGQLYKELEDKHRGFLAYRDLADAMPWLRKEGVIKVQSPSSMASTHDDLTVAATISDLADPTWVKAADPRRFGLATTRLHGVPSWHVFRPKIPRAFEAALFEQDEIHTHLLQPGTEGTSWQLSYAAGSSLSINVHLAAAEQLGLAPITDSILHHELMLRKLARRDTSTVSISDVSDISGTLTQRTIFNIIGQVLPAPQLAQLALQDVLEFRSRTQELRREFIADVARIIAAEIEVGKVGESERIVARVTNNLVESSRVYGSEMTAVRDKLWPKLIEGIRAPTAIATSTAGLAGSYISGSGYVLAASVILHALSPLKSALEWRAEKNKAQNSRSAIAYISKAQQFGRPG